MKLRDDLLRALHSLAGQSGQLVTFNDGPRTLRCQLVQCDPLGAAITELALESGELATADISRLESASQSLCQRVTYLLEPIAPIEIDSTGCVVQMRSMPPRKDDNKHQYYELSLRRGGAVMLHRYEKQPSAARQIIPALLTHEVLGRLTEDFDTAMNEVLTN
jgi:hypothetical protein